MERVGLDDGLVGRFDQLGKARIHVKMPSPISTWSEGISQEYIVTVLRWTVNPRQQI